MRRSIVQCNVLSLRQSPISADELSLSSQIFTMMPLHTAFLEVAPDHVPCFFIFLELSGARFTSTELPLEQLTESTLTLFTLLYL